MSVAVPPPAMLGMFQVLPANVPVVAPLAVTVKFPGNTSCTWAPLTANCELLVTTKVYVTGSSIFVLPVLTVFRILNQEEYQIIVACALGGVAVPKNAKLVQAPVEMICQVIVSKAVVFGARLVMSHRPFTLLKEPFVTLWLTYVKQPGRLSFTHVVRLLFQEFVTLT